LIGAEVTPPDATVRPDTELAVGARAAT
jgi:hypothetical protein